MQASKAKALYNEHWDKEFTTMEDLYARIKALAENGAYEMCVYIDSMSQYEEVESNLKLAGYDVEDYNGGNNGILQVSWP
jgi:hypothetical protein